MWALRRDLFRFPGSFLLLRFYRGTHTLTQLLQTESRRQGLLTLLNELLGLEDPNAPLLLPGQGHYLPDVEE